MSLWLALVNHHQPLMKALDWVVYYSAFVWASHRVFVVTVQDCSISQLSNYTDTKTACWIHMGFLHFQLDLGWSNFTACISLTSSFRCQPANCHRNHHGRNPICPGIPWDLTWLEGFVQALSGELAQAKKHLSGATPVAGNGVSRRGSPNLMFQKSLEHVSFFSSRSSRSRSRRRCCCICCWLWQTMTPGVVTPPSQGCVP